VYTQHPAQKFSPHSRNAKSTSTEAIITAGTNNPKMAMENMRNENSNPTRAAKILGALSIQCGSSFNIRAIPAENQLSGLYFD